MRDRTAVVYVVLRCRSLDNTCAFYASYGLVLEHEQNDLTDYYSLTLGSTVVEFRRLPAVGAVYCQTSGVRLGFYCPGRKPAMFTDPDGHQIEIC